MDLKTSNLNNLLKFHVLKKFNHWITNLIIFLNIWNFIYHILLNTNHKYQNRILRIYIYFIFINFNFNIDFYLKKPSNSLKFSLIFRFQATETSFFFSMSYTNPFAIIIKWFNFFIMIVKNQLMLMKNCFNYLFFSSLIFFIDFHQK